MLEKRTIDKIPARETKVFHVSQGDNNRHDRIDLVDGLEVVSIAASEPVIVRYKLPNGQIGSFQINNYGGTYLEFNIPSAVTQIPGLVYCKMRIGTIGYKAFFISVEGR